MTAFLRAPKSQAVRHLRSAKVGYYIDSYLSCLSALSFLRFLNYTAVASVNGPPKSSRFPVLVSISVLQFSGCLGNHAGDSPHSPHSKRGFGNLSCMSVTKFVCFLFTELNRSTDINVHDAH